MTEKKKTKKETKPVKAKEVKKLHEQIETLQKEKEELFDKLQRVSADYANFQKRGPKQISEAIAYEKEKIIKSILPVMDNFEHTLQNADAAEDKEIIVKGVKMIYDQMLDILKSHDIQQIKAANEKFDPSRHQAMLQQEDKEKEDGIVLQEFLKGYKLNDRIIRPSKVVVNKLKPEENNQ